MRILILLFFCLNITYVNADEIYNLLKIPNLEIFKLKSKNNIRYLNSNNDFKTVSYTHLTLPTKA